MEETQVFVGINMLEKRMLDENRLTFTQPGASLYDLGLPIPMHPPIAALIQRLLVFSEAKVSTQLCAFLGFISPTYGVAVMWAWTLHNMWAKREGRFSEIDLEVWTRFFPEGIPDIHAQRDIWEKQKNPNKFPDNELDQSETWGSNSPPMSYFVP